MITKYAAKSAQSDREILEKLIQLDARLDDVLTYWNNAVQTYEKASKSQQASQVAEMPTAIQVDKFTQRELEVECEETEGNILGLFAKVEQTNRELRGLQVGSEMTRTEKEKQRIEILQRDLAEQKKSLNKNRQLFRENCQ